MKILRSLLRRSEDEQRLDSLRHALHNTSHGTADPKSVRPVILPFKLGDRIPAYQFPCKDLYVMWVMTSPSAAAGFLNEVYVTEEHAAQLAGLGYSLPKLALRNVFDATGMMLSSHGRRDDQGNLTSIAFMHQDGYGPARILFHRYFGRLFPAGFWLAIPARSTAMAFSKALSEQELAEALKLVQHCFEAGDGVCQRRLHPEELAVPEEWLEDVDAWFEELADKNHDLRR